MNRKKKNLLIATIILASLGLAGFVWYEISKKLISNLEKVVSDIDEEIH